MKLIKKKALRRQRRKKHVRKNVFGTSERPRLTVFRSHKNMYAQLVDDVEGKTLVSASTRDKQTREQLAGHGGNSDAAKSVGAALAARAVEAGIKRAVFDRNGYPFHGRVRQLAEAAREAGLEF